MFSISSSSCCCVRFWVPCPRTSAFYRPVLPFTRPSYLECKVLEEVRGSVGLVRLSAAAGVNPHTDGRRLGPWRVLGRDLRGRVNGSPNGYAELVRTVKPLERVVDSVFEPWETGVANPLVKGDCLLRLTALMAAFERRAVCRFNASRREAIAYARSGFGDARAERRRLVMGWRMSLELYLLGER